ncbi:MAG: hypothetical protein ACI304_08975 [Lepagella sp.]
MKTNVIIWSVLIAIFAIWLICFHIFFEHIDFLGCIFLSILCTIVTPIIIYCIRAIIWRIQNGVDVFATLETDPKVVKNLLLFYMQYKPGGIKETLGKINITFKNYPQWDLSEWVVFRAWYKYQIDTALSRPEIYTVTNKYDGSPYDKDDDPLYDPEAPDWSLFEHMRDCDEEYKVYSDNQEGPFNDEDFDDEDNYDDIDDDDLYDDDYSRERKKFRKNAEEGFYTGLGLGASDI